MEKTTAGTRVIVVDGNHRGRTGELEGSADTGGNVRVIFDMLSKYDGGRPRVKAWIHAAFLKKIEGGQS